MKNYEFHCSRINYFWLARNLFFSTLTNYSYYIAAEQERCFELCQQDVQYSPTVLGHFANFKSSHNIHPPFPPRQCWFLGEGHAIFSTITPSISGTDQHCFWGEGGAWKLQYLICYKRYSFL